MRFQAVSTAVLLTCLANLTPVRAQLTTIVDNLSQPTISSDTAAGTPYDNGWHAQGFTTPVGTAYTLSEVTVRLSRESNPQDFSGNFTVSLWDATGPSGVPLSNQGTVGTADVSSIPTAVPTFSNIAFTPSTSIVLSPGTTYFVVVQASASLATAGLYWGLTDSSNPADGEGTMGNWTTYGGSWEPFVQTETDLQMAVTATPVPEPQLYALFAGLGLMAFAGLRSWKRRAACWRH